MATINKYMCLVQRKDWILVLAVLRFELTASCLGTDFECYLILMNLNVYSHMWLVATILDRGTLEGRSHIESIDWMSASVRWADNFDNNEGKLQIDLMPGSSDRRLCSSYFLPSLAMAYLFLYPRLKCILLQRHVQLYPSPTKQREEILLQSSNLPMFASGWIKRQTDSVWLKAIWWASSERRESFPGQPVVARAFGAGGG
jgi:hypothetical protein